MAVPPIRSPVVGRNPASWDGRGETLGRSSSLRAQTVWRTWTGLWTLAGPSKSMTDGRCSGSSWLSRPGGPNGPSWFLCAFCGLFLSVFFRQSNVYEPVRDNGAVFFRVCAGLSVFFFRLVQEIRAQDDGRQEGDQVEQVVERVVALAQEKLRVVFDVYLPRAEASASRDGNFQQGHGHHELVCERRVRQDCRGERAPGPLLEETHHYEPRSADRGAPHPARRTGQARRVRGHQGRHQVQLE